MLIMLIMLMMVIILTTRRLSSIGDADHADHADLGNHADPNLDFSHTCAALKLYDDDVFQASVRFAQLPSSSFIPTSQ